jgi:hypothetical protein
MSSSDVTREGLRGVRPDRDALTGVAYGRRRRPRRDGDPTMPRAEFRSYYGKPILNAPTWESPDIPGYLFLGGLAGAGALLGAGAQAGGRNGLARRMKVGVLAAGLLSLLGLVHDLGRPGRFLHMLRVFKVTSPMSVGSWLLAGFVPLAGVSAASALTGRLPRIGAAATAGSAALGPAVAAYTAALVSDTAVPAWHDGHRQMPFVFVGSGAAAAGGLGMVSAPAHEQEPARYLGVLGAALELAAFERMEKGMGRIVAEPYSSGRGGAYTRASKVLAAAGIIGALLGRGNTALTRAAGAALVAGSAATRWGIFHAGMQSAQDPRYTVVPQRARRQASSGATRQPCHSPEYSGDLPRGTPH